MFPIDFMLHRTNKGRRNKTGRAKNSQNSQPESVVTAAPFIAAFVEILKPFSDAQGRSGQGQGAFP